VFDYAHLEALLAVEREGSFEGAAKSLGLTSSAISQRVKLLEARIGAVLINRQAPIKPTKIGIELCRHAELVTLLEDKILTSNGCNPVLEGTKKPVIKIVVNDDSLSSWFLEVLQREANEANPFMYEVSIADQDYSIDELKLGSVLAAITVNKTPVQGFTSRYLGMHIYRATASPAFMKRHFPQGVTAEALQKAPSLRYSSQDDLQQQWIMQNFGKAIMHDNHILPSSHGFVNACLCDIAWGMNPALMVDKYIASGDLVELIPGQTLDKPLYWHCSRMVSDSLRKFTQNVIEVAENNLDQNVKS